MMSMILNNDCNIMFYDNKPTVCIPPSALHFLLMFVECSHNVLRNFSQLCDVPGMLVKKVPKDFHKITSNGDKFEHCRE